MEVIKLICREFLRISVQAVIFFLVFFLTDLFLSVGRPASTGRLFPDIEMIHFTRGRTVTKLPPILSRKHWKEKGSHVERFQLG